MEFALSIELSLLRWVKAIGKPISVRKQTDLYRHPRRHPRSKSNLQIVLENSPHLFFKCNSSDLKSSFELPTIKSARLYTNT